MPGRGTSTYRQSAFWIAASFVALIVGLVMLMHEQHAHDVCTASIHDLGRSLKGPPSSCGFADTVYWAGMVVFLTAAISLIAAMWSGVTTLSASFHVRGRPNWPTSADPLTSGDVTLTRSEPAAWLSLTSPAPFQAPQRRQNPPPKPAEVSPLEPVTVVAAQTAAAVSARTSVSSSPLDEARSSAGSAPQPAWYPDPDNSDAIRWWDGARWGESRPRSN